jgi:hypothetical protein
MTLEEIDMSKEFFAFFCVLELSWGSHGRVKSFAEPK